MYALEDWGLALAVAVFVLLALLLSYWGSPAGSVFVVSMLAVVFAYFFGVRANQRRARAAADRETELAPDRSA